MAEQDILQPISKENVVKLLHILEKDMPQSTVPYHWIRCQTDWETKIHGIKVHILCPNGDWSNGTVVAFTDGLALEGRQYGVVYAREGEGDAELAKALLQTRVIPWKTMIHFTCVLERHVGPLVAAVKAAGIILPTRQPQSYLAHYPAEQAANIEMPNYFNAETTEGEKIRVGRLYGHHLDEVWSLRPHFPDCYKPVIEAALDHNVLSIGIFVQKPDCSEKLVSIAIHAEHGGLGLGQTHPDYLHRGFNTLAGGHVMKAMGLQGWSPNGATWTSNKIVLTYLKTYGFEIIGKTERVVISPGGECKYLKGRL